MFALAISHHCSNQFVKGSRDDKTIDMLAAAPNDGLGSGPLDGTGQQSI
jgi:hypothetical protein